MNEKFDVIIIGAGPGGYISAIKSAQENLKTLIIEKEYWGGVCLNIGCIPTKVLLKNAKILDIIKHAKFYGIDITNLNKIIINWDNMQKRKNEVINNLKNKIKYLLKKNKIIMLKGEAKAITKNIIEVEGKHYICDNLIIATGSVPKKLILPGFNDVINSKYIITSKEALSLITIPKKLAIIGGGVIGVEFAFLFCCLGVEVTILQTASIILEMLDHDISNEVTEILIKKQVNIKTNIKIKEIKNKTIIYFDENNKEQQLITDYCLISIGRIPMFKGFENIGLNIDINNNIKINEKCQTNISGVYAIGDVIGGGAMLAHVASAQGIVAINTIKGISDKIEYNKIPSCIYLFPEVAMVGLTEEQVKQKNIDYRIFKYPLSVNSKALADNETKGFIKIICEIKYGEILGAHMVCTSATDMISEITVCMKNEITIYELSKTIHPHPTLAEIIGDIANELNAFVIHK